MPRPVDEITAAHSLSQFKPAFSLVKGVIYHVAVLSNRQFIVVVDGTQNWLRAAQVELRHAELLQEGVLQHLLSGDTFLRNQSQHSHDQIDRQRIEPTKQRVPIDRLEGDTIQESLDVLSLEILQFFFPWFSCEGQHPLQLIEIGVAREQRPSGHHLR